MKTDKPGQSRTRELKLASDESGLLFTNNRKHDIFLKMWVGDDLGKSREIESEVVSIYPQEPETPDQQAVIDLVFENALILECLSMKRVTHPICGPLFDLGPSVLPSAFQPQNSPILSPPPTLPSTNGGVATEKTNLNLNRLGRRSVVKHGVNECAVDESLYEVSGEIQPLIDGTRRIVLEGHTDQSGDCAYNYALGHHRAQRFSDALIELGVPSSSISIESCGEENPSGFVNFADQRRVEMIILDGDREKTACKTTCAIDVSSVNIDQKCLQVSQ